MANVNVIPVGSETKAKYLAFGDDSQFRDVLTYAVVIVRRTRVTQVERKIKELKESYRIPEHVPLHCRILFNQHPREKAGLGHLSNDDACAIVVRAVTIMNQGNVILRYATEYLSRFKARIGNEVEFTHKTDGSKLTVPATPDPKGALGTLMLACFSVPPGKYGPTASECEIFASEDATKISFIGNRRRRADGFYSGFSDVGAPDGNVFQLKPTILQAAASPLLQLADIAAYMCSHASDSSEQDGFFREQLSRVRLWVTCTFDGQPPLEPNESHRS